MWTDDLIGYAVPGCPVVRVTAARIASSSDLQPCALVAPPCGSGGALGAVSVYLQGLRSETGAPFPTLVEVEVRARFGPERSEVVASFPLAKLSSWDGCGSVVHLSGRRASAFELWARHNGVGTIRCEVRFIVADAAAAVPWFVEPGALV